MTDRDVSDVLDRAVAALSPRDPDPVGALLRRVRARRRRRVAAVSLALVAVAGVGAVGTQLGRGEVRSQTPPASRSGTDERDAARLSENAVEVNGVTVPVPDGWKVERLTTIPGDCGKPGSRLTARTVFVLPDDYLGHAPCQSEELITVAPGTRLSRFGSGDLTLHASGQPAWIEVLEKDETVSLILPWSKVVVSSQGTTPEQASTYLSGVKVSGRDPDGKPLVVEGKATAFGWSDVGALHAGSEAPGGGRTEDAQLAGQVVALIEEGRPVDRLDCLPASDKVVVLDIASLSLAFDRTGACDIAFDDRGSAARIDAPALMSLLEPR